MSSKAPGAPIQPALQQGQQPGAQPPGAPPPTRARQNKDERVAFEFPVGWYPPQYDVENDPHFDVDETTFYLGERRSGKSTTCAIWNLIRRRLYPVVLVFSKTAHNHYWHQFVPDEKIAHDCDEEVASEIIETNGRRYTEWKRIKERTGKYTGNPIVKIIYEDCITENQLRVSPSVKTIALNGRHFGISCDILSQDYIGLDPGERDNMDRWVIWRPDSGRTRNMIRESFGDEVLAIAERVWANSAALVINKKKRIPIQERITWYSPDVPYLKSAIHKNLCLGNARYWAGKTVEKQKKEFPYVDLPSLDTLRSKFNDPIKDQEAPMAEQSMALVGMTPDNEGKQLQITSGASSAWFSSLFSGDAVVW